MASLGNALVTKILGHSAAEKAFRPWWDNLEDFLVYGLVMLGLVVAPTAVINSTPLDCNYCQVKSTIGHTTIYSYHFLNNWDCDRNTCNFFQDLNCFGKFTVNLTQTKETDPGFNAWWVKKYCTMTQGILLQSNIYKYIITL